MVARKRRQASSPDVQPWPTHRSAGQGCSTPEIPGRSGFYCSLLHSLATSAGVADSMKSPFQQSAQSQYQWPFSRCKSTWPLLRHSYFAACSQTDHIVEVPLYHLQICSPSCNTSCNICPIKLLMNGSASAGRDLTAGCLRLGPDGRAAGRGSSHGPCRRHLPPGHGAH